VLRWLTLILPIKGLSSVPQAIFERNLEFRLLAQRAIFANAVGGAAGVAAAIAGFGVWSLVIQAVLSAAGGTALLWMRTSWRPGFNVSYSHFRDLFSFGVHITGSNLMAFASRNGDTILIGAVLGSVALGLYSVAYRVLLVMTDILTRSFATVTFPVFSRVQADPARMQRGFFSATELAAAIAFPAFALTAVFAPELVDVIFGAQWTACVPVLQILTGIGALQTLTFFNVSVLKALGRADWVFRISSLNAVLCLVAFSITVKWGIEAVAASYVAAGLVIAPVSVLAVNKRLRFSTWAYARQLLGPVVATLVASALAYFGRQYAAPHLSSLALLAVLSAPALLAYAISLRFVAPHTAHEAMRLIKKVFPALPLRGGRVAPAAEAPH
jgi:PST family polysaccharide transporter